MNEALPIIDTAKFSEHLRVRGIRPEQQQILITNFKGSQQEQDLSAPTNCAGYGRIHHFRRPQPHPWPSNPLPIDPAARALGLPQLDEIQAQVFQNAICSWRCWYCFVDFDLLSANPAHAQFMSADDLLDLYVAERTRPVVIDLSGGQPDLVPEWSLWMSDAIARRGLTTSVYLWTDDNLSNDYLWRFLKSEEIERLRRSANYGRVGCFKGFDEKSFSFNTKAAPALFYEQFGLMNRLVTAGFDVYGYATFTGTSDNEMHILMSRFVDSLQEQVHPLFPLRTIPLRIGAFTPTKGRMREEHVKAMAVQETAIYAWNAELEKRFCPEQRAANITLHRLSQ
jgi:uncharacterized Fe-S cluster-containing radical SAM superfamily protein